MSDTGRRLAQLSQWIDDANSERLQAMSREELLAEALHLTRLIKVAEERGETVEAFIGFAGQNPRKGFTHSRADVSKELLDVATSALGAWEHLNGNDGSSFLALARHVASLCERAGLPAIGANAR